MRSSLTREWQRVLNGAVPHGINEWHLLQTLHLLSLEQARAGDHEAAASTLVRLADQHRALMEEHSRWFVAGAAAAAIEFHETSENDRCDHVEEGSIEMMAASSLFKRGPARLGPCPALGPEAWAQGPAHCALNQTSSTLQIPLMFTLVGRIACRQPARSVWSATLLVPAA